MKLRTKISAALFILIVFFGGIGGINKMLAKPKIVTNQVPKYITIPAPGPTTIPKTSVVTRLVPGTPATIYVPVSSPARTTAPTKAPSPSHSPSPSPSPTTTSLLPITIPRITLP